MALLALWRQRQAQRRWRQEAVILWALREKPNQGGYDLWKRTGFPPARVYAVLWRLEGDGRVASRWSEIAWPDGTRRRLYRLAPTAGGQR